MCGMLTLMYKIMWPAIEKVTSHIIVWIGHSNQSWTHDMLHSHRTVAEWIKSLMLVLHIHRKLRNCSFNNLVSCTRSNVPVHVTSSRDAHQLTEANVQHANAIYLVEMSTHDPAADCIMLYEWDQATSNSYEDSISQTAQCSSDPSNSSHVLFGYLQTCWRDFGMSWNKFTNCALLSLRHRKCTNCLITQVKVFSSFFQSCRGTMWLEFFTSWTIREGLDPIICGVVVGKAIFAQPTCCLTLHSAVCCRTIRTRISSAAFVHCTLTARHWYTFPCSSQRAPSGATR